MLVSVGMRRRRIVLAASGRMTITRRAAAQWRKKTKKHPQ